eukprot:COSAG05_NODE_1909_length_3846_cov_3.179610_3_plen_95_part_00
MDAFTAAGFAVLGCSADEQALQTSWKAKQSFNFDLVCDEQFSLIEAVGMKKGAKGVRRGNVIVGPDGIVQAAELLSPADSVAKALAHAGGDGGS